MTTYTFRLDPDQRMRDVEETLRQFWRERAMGWDPAREDCIEGEFRVLATRPA